MNTDTTTAPAPATSTPLITLIECAKQRCGHILLESEQEWTEGVGPLKRRTAICPKCGHDSFYTLTAQGSARTTKDRDTPREIDPRQIEPTPRMGLTRRRRLLAAKRRALSLLLDPSQF